MKYSNLKAFEKHVDGASPHHFSNLYLIIAPDSFLRKTAVNYLSKALLAKEPQPELCLKYLEGSRSEPDSLSGELDAFSLFSKKQVTVIENAEKLPKSSMKMLENYFSQTNPTTYLIISAESVNRSTNFYKNAEKVGIVLELAEPKPADKEIILLEWANAKVLSAGKQIDAQACQHLVKQSEGDAAFLNMELEKLFCYLGERNKITLQDISAVCATVNLETIWQLGDAIFRRDGAAALRISKALLQSGTAFLALLRQIRNQMQTDFQVCSLLINGQGASEIGKLFPYMKGYILDRHIQAAQSYGINGFRQGMKQIDAYELLAKNSDLDHELLIELLIAKLTKKASL